MGCLLFEQPESRVRRKFQNRDIADVPQTIPGHLDCHRGKLLFTPAGSPRPAVTITVGPECRCARSRGKIYT